MNITLLPFNKLIGLEPAGPANDCMVSLSEGPQYLNHLGTVHASALLAVAEAGSGEFLVRNFGHIRHLVPVLRKLEAKFRKSATGRITARCSVAPGVVAGWIEKLESSGRLSAVLPVDVIDSTGNVVLIAVAEWFITKVHNDA